MENKLKLYMEGLIVYKNFNENSFFKSINIPSFLRDFLIQRYSDEDGNLDFDSLKKFVKEYLPKKEEWPSFKSKMVHDRETVKILAKISTDIEIRTQQIRFSLPDFDLSEKDTIIRPEVWEEYKSYLNTGEPIWAIVELRYIAPDDDERIREGKIELIGFKEFKPYTIDLEHYKNIRNNFTTKEWIDVILGAIDYNPDGYSSDEEKLTVIKRLLPFLEKRINIIELAPKGTGKSHLFSNISRHGWLSSGGKMSRAKLFYDMNKKREGILHNNDFIALDEVQTITFTDVNEMRSMLKGYLESGQYSLSSGYTGVSGAGIILLGNIEQSFMNIEENMFKELPLEFRESALIDRFHGFIEGWKIPRMNETLKVNGWAVNSEYFCTILHLLRDEMDYRIIVDKLVEIPLRADTRDTEAIKRITTGYLKLLFPNVRCIDDVDLDEFFTYCLKPAIHMRQIIKIQLGILDREFIGKDVPNLKVKGLEY